jgi:hypothetical protein
VRGERWEERGVWEPRWAIRVKYIRECVTLELQERWLFPFPKGTDLNSI